MPTQPRTNGLSWQALPAGFPVIILLSSFNRKSELLLTSRLFVIPSFPWDLSFLSIVSRAKGCAALDEMAQIDTQQVAVKDKGTVSVSKDTYQSIARFAILHSLNQETVALLKVAEKELQAVVDAEDELLLVDDELVIPCQVDHPSFFNKSKDQANSFLEEEKSRLQKEIDELTHRRAQNDSEIKELRGVLYSKLGDAVQLEGNEEDDD